MTSSISESGLQEPEPEIQMADNQKAKHGDSQSGQKNDLEKNKDQGQQGRHSEEGNRGSRFAQGGEGDQKQDDNISKKGNQGQSGSR
jgi:hypothetical protein